MKEAAMVGRHIHIVLLSAYVAPLVRMHGGPLETAAGCGLTERKPVGAARRSRRRYRLDGQRPDHWLVL